MINNEMLNVLMQFEKLKLNLIDFNKFVIKQMNENNKCFCDYEKNFIEIHKLIDDLIEIRNEKFMLNPITIDDMNKLNEKQKTFK